jgi:hypothetical protein
MKGWREESGMNRGRYRGIDTLVLPVLVSCSDFPVPAAFFLTALFWLSCPCCLVSLIMIYLSCIRYPSLCFLVQAVLSQLSYTDSPVLSRLSYPGGLCPVCPVLSYSVTAALPRLSCPSCLVIAVLSQLSFPDRPVLSVLSWLSWELSCPGCLIPAISAISVLS